MLQEQLGVAFDVHPCVQQPEHPTLQNEFRCFTNYPSKRFGGWEKDQIRNEGNHAT